MIFAFELSFRGWFPGWAAVLMGLAGTIAVALLYLREAGRLGIGTRLLAAALRAASLALILFLVMKPSLLWESRSERRRPIAVLADDSQSMLVRDARPDFPDRRRTAIAFNLIDAKQPIPTMPSTGDLPAETPEKPSRLELEQALLTHPKMKLLERLGQRGPVLPSSFGTRRSSLDGRTTDWVKALQGKEPRTALAESAFDWLKRDELELPAAMVLFTDGRENAGPRTLTELAVECRKRDVPLFVVGLGSSNFGRLSFREVVAAETLFVDDIVAVPIRFRAQGHVDQQAEIVLKLNGREVARKTVTLTDSDDLREVLLFTPTIADAAAGKQELSTSIRLSSDGDKPSDEALKSVRVVDRKLKVLVVDSTPRWDFKYLQRSLLRDRRVEARFWLSEGDREAMKAGPPFLPNFPMNREELNAYDLLILGDLPASALSSVQQEAIREFVAEGGGFIHIAGRQAGPASFAGTPIADVLPVDVPSIKFPIDANMRTASFRPQLTAQGARHPALRLDDDPARNGAVWKELPEIFWHYPVTALKPAAEALLAHPTAKTADGKPMPLIAAHYYGKGQAVFVGIDETWRWRYNEADRWFGRFWTQAVYNAGVPRTLGTKLTQLSLDTLEPQLGKTGQVYARLLKPDLTPQTADQVEAVLERLDVPAGDAGRLNRIMLRKLPGTTGDYLAVLPFAQVGRTALTVDNGGNPGTLEYRVTLPADHELAPGGMMEEDLRKLAADTGGKFYREETVDELPNDVQGKSVPIVRREETVLWNVWSLLAVVLLFSVEWIVRKWSSLS